MKKIGSFLNNYKDKKNVSEAVIYEWPCEGNDNEQCNKVYIGESRKGMEMRSTQHLNHVKNGNTKDSAIADHACNVGHKFNPLNIRILEKESNTFRRKVKEGLYIQSNPNTINKNNGKPMNSIWTHILRKKISKRKFPMQPT